LEACSHSGTSTVLFSCHTLAWYSQYCSLLAKTFVQLVHDVVEGLLKSKKCTIAYCKTHNKKEERAPMHSLRTFTLCAICQQHTWHTHTQCICGKDPAITAHINLWLPSSCFLFNYDQIK
jgi:hypothetical protein